MMVVVEGVFVCFVEAELDCLDWSFYDENRHRQGCFWIVPGSLHPPLSPHHPPSLVYPCGGLVEREDFEGGWWWRMMVEVAC